MADAPSAPPAAPPDPLQLLRDRRYVVVLILGAIIGVPVATVAYFFLEGVARSQTYLFQTLPDDLGFDGQPAWWPTPLLVIGGLIVGLTIRHLPGTAGHKPAEGLKTGGAVQPIELAGIAIAAFATLVCGAVLGPEAPLIAIGSGLGVLAVHLFKRDAPEMAVLVIGGAGSFAAIATLFGSPLAAAFLLMEASGLGGAMMSAVLVPGLLAAGVGALIYVGLDDWTGFGTFSLGLGQIPSASSPTFAQFLWAIAIGVLGAILGMLITRAAMWFQPIIERRIVLLTPVAGLAMGICVWAFVSITDEPSEFVLFSGQDQLGPLLEGAAGWSVGSLIVLGLCKSVAYGAALSCFRGGPVFPAMFIGAVGGIALSHLPGLPMIAGAGMGIGAMTVAMLRLPLVSVLLAAVFLASDAAQLMPTIIVAVAVAYVVRARLDPAPAPTTAPAPSAA